MTRRGRRSCTGSRGGVVSALSVGEPRHGMIQLRLEGRIFFDLAFQSCYFLLFLVDNNLRLVSGLFVCVRR